MSQTSETERLEDPGPQPMRAEPAATYGINPPTHIPHPHPRVWPLGAKLTVGVLVAVLAAVLALSLVTLRSVTARQSRTDARVSALDGAVGLNASQASQANSKTGDSVASLQSQLGAVEAQLSALAARVRHHGLCLNTLTDRNGFIKGVTLSPPVMVSGNDSCPSGVFVSAVPTRG